MARILLIDDDDPVRKVLQPNFERFAEALHDLGLYWLHHNQPPKVAD